MMSSHREAPEILHDPAADNTDLYAFVSPDRPDTVTIIANFIPFEDPAGGPYFYPFADDVLYEIKIDNDGDGHADITYQFRFTTQVRNPGSFLYNLGPISSLNDPNWNFRQVYSVTKVWSDRKGNGRGEIIGSNLPCPPDRVGPRSTPNYEGLASAAIHSLSSGERVFAGQRDEGFYIDIGSIFDLGTLRPFQNLHLAPMAARPGIDGTSAFNVKSIALQIPKELLTADGSTPSDPLSPTSRIGVYASASRQKAMVRGGNGARPGWSGPYVQVSRLGMPLINEVVIPVGRKDQWNAVPPWEDAQFIEYYRQPELAKLIPVLYPGVFPNLAGLSDPRNDLVAILLTGIPAGVVPDFPGTFTGNTPADLLRLNMAVPPSDNPSVFGLLGGDAAGFPNGRRVFDDVTAIELRAIAGATYPLVAPSYTPDAPAASIDDGITRNENGFLSSFPYLATPHEGYDHAHDHFSH
jgi:hypothetical protein